MQIRILGIVLVFMLVFLASTLSVLEAKEPLPFDQPGKPVFIVQPAPASGAVETKTNAERIAPFEIKAAQGSHYLVKLVNAHTNSPVMTVFVRGGTTVNVDVPIGSYEVRYASGETWYGYKHLFGPDTTYSKADTTFDFKIMGNQVRGFTITLYKVANGNLQTSKIRPEMF